MINSNANAVGVIFPNSYDELVPELVTDRLMASIPFASRYRLVDFILSSMANSQIDSVSMVVRKNYHSLMDHLGSGREWDLTRKNGGLNIVPPFAGKTSKVYNGRIEALASILEFLSSQKEDFIILSDANIAINFDFRELINAHIESGADVTVCYNKEELPASARNHEDDNKGMYYTFTIDDTGRVTDIKINPRDSGIQNFSMNIYIIGRKLLCDLVYDAFVHGYSYFERDVLAPNLEKLKIYGYEYKGYVARISDLRSYYHENLKLLDIKNLDALFDGDTIYTKTRDDNPTQYMGDIKVSNVMAGDGCEIAGDVENCVLFRGVKIGKGAKVKNSILMTDTVIEPNAVIDSVITDKRVTVTEGREIRGTDTYPIFIGKGEMV